MTKAAEFVEPLRRLHDSIRGLVVSACEQCFTEELSTVAHDGAGDVIYAIDKISESALIEWFNREIASHEEIILIGEGLPNGRVVLPDGAHENDVRWCVIVDPIDGTRGLMYQKRPAWILTGVAPNRGDKTSMADIEVAVQTEIPLVKQHLCDQLWAIRGGGVSAVRQNRLTDEVRPLAVQPSTAVDLRHGFATVCRFLPGGRDVLAALDEDLCDRVLSREHGEVGVFEDQYACTGGQLYNLATGQDRFVADLRPLVQRFAEERGIARGHCCHPYDLCTKLIAEEAGVIVTAPGGGTIEAPLDTDTNVAWVGYANRQLQSLVEPVLEDLMREYELTATDDFAEHLDRLRRLPEYDDPSLRTFFNRQSSIYVARAPGRLDVMGGIGDYSGSLVLEMPIAEAAFAAVQLTHEGDVTIASLRSSTGNPAIIITITSSEWAALQAGDFEAARQFFAHDPLTSWAAYVAGPVLVLLRETQAKFDGGLRILIDSNVPEGKGVSSSAAVEVATMRAFAAAIGVELPGDAVSRMCQFAENRVVGAPCGIMDQMTSALGRENELLALRCQPATVEGFVPIPTEVAFWGIDSGIRHDVSGSDYTSVRCGAFMGYQMIAEVAGLEAEPASDATHVIEVNDPLWNGFLANITRREFRNRFASAIPAQMSGREFLDQYNGTTDRVTRIDPDRTYAILAPTLHPIEEDERAERFRALLEGAVDDAALREMGQLMAAAHESYSACGLGSAGTDLLVSLVRDAGPASGLYGAKITGGGSGGAVAILGRSDAEYAVANIARRYTELTKREAYVFHGSSPGAYGTPVREVVI